VSDTAGQGLVGRTALVTGASGGLGAAFADMLVSAGAAVALHYHNNEQKAIALAERFGGVGKRLCTVQGDLRTTDGPAAVCQHVEEGLGPIDILINNAGGWVGKPLLDTSVGEWDELMEADVRGSFLTIIGCAAGMKSRGWGRIVNLSTVAALSVATNEGAYGVAKAAVVMLTKTAAVELAEFGVTVNAIAPGWTLPYDSPHPPQPKDYPQSARVPDHRPGHATEVAAIARFLVSEEAGHITGQTIAVDGGLSAVLASSS